MSELSNSDYAAIIKECVPVRDAVQAYVSAPIRHNRIPCPFHGGTDYNMGIKTKWFHCFVCGCGGDVIDFTRKLFHLSWFDAVCKLNDDFHLDLPVRGSKDVSDQAKRAIAEAKQKQQQTLMDEMEQNTLELEYDTMCAALVVVEKICKEDAPAPWDDEWDPVWCQAMKMKTELKEHIEQLDLERLLNEEKRKHEKR